MQCVVDYLDGQRRTFFNLDSVRTTKASLTMTRVFDPPLTQPDGSVEHQQHWNVPLAVIRVWTTGSVSLT